MFRKGRHVEKNICRSEEMYCFVHWIFFHFKWKNNGNSCKKRENRFCTQQLTKIHVRNDLFWQNSSFYSVFGIPLGCQGPPGTSEERPEIVYFSPIRLIAPESEPARPPEALRKATGHPPGALRVLLWSDFWIDFAHHKQTKKWKIEGKSYKSVTTVLVHKNRPKSCTKGNNCFNSFSGKVP